MECSSGRRRVEEGCRAHFKASNESGDDFGAIGFSRQPRVHNGDEDEEVGKADGAKGKAHNRATLEGGEEALS